MTLRNSSLEGQIDIISIMKEVINPKKLILPDLYESSSSVEKEIMKHIAPFLQKKDAEIEMRLGRIISRSNVPLWDQFPVKIPTILNKTDNSSSFAAGVSKNQFYMLLNSLKKKEGVQTLKLNCSTIDYVRKGKPRVTV